MADKHKQNMFLQEYPNLSLLKFSILHKGLNPYEGLVKTRTFPIRNKIRSGKNNSFPEFLRNNELSEKQFSVYKLCKKQHIPVFNIFISPSLFPYCCAVLQSNGVCMRVAENLPSVPSDVSISHLLFVCVVPCSTDHSNARYVAVCTKLLEHRNLSRQP